MNVIPDGHDEAVTFIDADNFCISACPISSVRGLRFTAMNLPLGPHTARSSSTDSIHSLRVRSSLSGLPRYGLSSFS